MTHCQKLTTDIKYSSSVWISDYTFFNQFFIDNMNSTSKVVERLAER